MKKIILAIVILFFIASFVEANEIDVSFTGSLTYDTATWKSGEAMELGGPKGDVAIGFNPAIQLKYSRWSIQPTLEVGYLREHFDFTRWYAPIEQTNPRSWHVLGGISFGLGRNFFAYTLMGVTRTNYYPRLKEIYPKQVHNGRPISLSDTLYTGKIGVYRLFDLGVLNLKVGPEASLTVYHKAPGFSRCREYNSSQIVPVLGLRIQWH